MNITGGLSSEVYGCKWSSYEVLVCLSIGMSVCLSVCLYLCLSV